MSIWEDLDRRAKRLGILDTKLAQGGAFFLALILAKLEPRIMDLNPWWFVGLAAACAIRPSLVFFGRGDREAGSR